MSYKKRLENAFNQSVKKDGILNRYVLRRLSILLVPVFSKLNFSPNFVSILSFCANILGSFFIINSNYFMAILSLTLSLILDCSDGQLAIFDNKKSSLGQFLDPLFDRLSEILIFGALAINSPIEIKNIIFIGYVIFLLLFYIRYYLLHYIEKYNVKFGNSEPKKLSNRAKSILIQNIKWDGTFTAIIYIGFALFGFIHFIFFPTIIYLIISNLLLLIKILKRVSNEKNS